MAWFEAQDPVEYLAQKRKEWVGKESGDYVVTDVVREVYGNTLTPLLVIKCKVCNVVKKVTIQTFLRSKNMHGSYCVANDWDAKLKALKDKFLWKTSGQFTCFDVLKQWNKSMGCYSPMILAECKICGNKKEFTVRDFSENENRHEKVCAVLNDFRSHVGEQIEDQRILNYVRRGNTAFYVVKCIKCGRVYEIGCQKFFKRASQTHEHLCEKPVGTARFRDVWHHMSARCRVQTNKDYPNYGGRGICIKWNDVKEFYNDMFESYKKLSEEIGEENVSIERIDVNGDYCKENCKWIHRCDQESNKQNTIYFVATDPQGRKYYGRNLSKFCDEHDLNVRHMTQVMRKFRTHHKNWKCQQISRDEYIEYCSKNFTSLSEQIWQFMNEKYEERIDTRLQEVYTYGLRLNLLEISSNLNIYIWDELLESIVHSENPYGLDISYDRKRKCFFLKKAKDFISEESVG